MGRPDAHRIEVPMHPFEQTISIVAPFVLAIIVLTLFFQFMGWIARGATAKSRNIAIKGILDQKTPATVHLMNGTTFENVRLIGFTDSSSVKGPFPYELMGMLILEDPDGRRISDPGQAHSHDGRGWPYFVPVSLSMP